MENKNSQIFGGESFPETENGIFSVDTEKRQEGFISGATTDMERDLGVKALEGIDDLASVPADAGNVEKVIEGSGVIAASGEADVHTEKGVDELVEKAEKSVDEAKREHNVLKMQEEKIALGRKVIEMVRSNGGVQ